MSTISKEQHDELCVAYASMILFDAEHEITSQSIEQIVQASGNEVEPYWPTLFSSLLSKEGKVLEIISSGGAVAGGAPSTTGPSTGSSCEVDEKVVEKSKEEEDDAADLGGGIDMFGGEDY
ncbi:hypothetical protein CCR75_008708 [Bremia lactucae]|uniref:60S acidic ribosomal protein P1 n=1 Tax=Bremia lactucae TaxID=4779 RepID=A0A976NZY2_BRELC|nr:hypothetical protein CCR75_008708 [Bremia lactucae]